MMYDYNWTKHMMCGIKHQESERDGKKLDFLVQGCIITIEIVSSLFRLVVLKLLH